MIIVCLGLPNSGIQLAFNAVSRLVEAAGYDQMRVRRDFISKQPKGTKGGNLTLTPSTFGTLLKGVEQHGTIVIKTPVLSIDVIRTLSEEQNVKIIAVKSEPHLDRVHGARFGGFEKNDATYGLQRHGNILRGRNEEECLKALKSTDLLNVTVRELTGDHGLFVDRLADFLTLPQRSANSMNIDAVKEGVLSLTTADAIFTGIVRTIGVIDSLERDNDYLYLSITTSNKPNYLSNYVSISGLKAKFMSFSAMGMRGVLEVKIQIASVSEEVCRAVFDNACVNIEFGTHALDELGGNYLLARPIILGTLEFLELGNKTIRCHFKFPNVQSLPLKSGDGVGLNGVAMTVESVDRDALSFCMIEDTQKLTALSYLVRGSQAVLERDALGLRRIYPKHDRDRATNASSHVSG